MRRAFESSRFALFSETPMTDRILILDFGSQVTQLIARRVRENGVYCEIWPYTATADRIREFARRGIILSGGPASVTRADTPRAPDIVFRLGVPVLGICYGMQTHVRPARRQGHAQRASGIRPRLYRHHRRMPPVRGAVAAGRARTGLDEPRRQGRCVAARLPRRGGERRRALRRGRRRRAPVLRRAVPPRGRAHAAGRPAARQFHAPRLRLLPATGRWRRSAPRRSRGSAPGRLRPGDLRTVGRRRFGGRGGACCTRRSATS